VHSVQSLLLLPEPRKAITLLINTIKKTVKGVQLV